MATRPPPKTLILWGPPVSRAKQLKLGIAKFVPALGSEKVRCCRCHKHLWLGPKQLQVLEAKADTEVICLMCGRSEFKAGLADGTIAMTHLGGRGGSYYQKDGKFFGPPEEFRN